MEPLVILKHVVSRSCFYITNFLPVFIGQLNKFLPKALSSKASNLLSAIIKIFSVFSLAQMKTSTVSLFGKLIYYTKD